VISNHYSDLLILILINHFLTDFDFDLMFLGRKSLYSTFHLYTVNECGNSQFTSMPDLSQTFRVLHFSRMEALNYLDDTEKDLQILSGYPNVCATFLKYNTSLPSSAPVEHLFSTGGLILTPHRNKLSDVFEQLLMLKTNADMIHLK